MPKEVGFRCEASRSSPELRAGPSGLWQWAQLISSQARARASSVPLLGSSQTASRGAAVGIRRAGERPKSAPVRQLVLGVPRIGEVAVEVARLGADRPHDLAGLVASLALVGVGDDVVVGPRTAVGVNPAHVDRIAGDVERGLGLLFVPDIGQTNPAVGLALEDPGLDQPPPPRRIACVAREGEGLGDHGTDGKLEDVVWAVGGMGCRAAA